MTEEDQSGETFPVDLPPEHQDVYRSPPEFTEEQLTYLEAMLALECCHATGMHDPDHFKKHGSVCRISMEKAWIRIVDRLGIEVPVYSAHDCGWCRDYYVGDPSPFDSPHPRYAPGKGVLDRESEDHE